MDINQIISTEKNYKHSLNKPMSTSQKTFIATLANENSIDIESYAKQKLGKFFSDCSSADADELIKTIKR